MLIQRGRYFEVKSVNLLYFFKQSSLLPGIDQANQLCSNDKKEGFTKIVNFMTPGAGVLVLGRGHISHIVKMLYFFNNLLLYTQA